MEVSLFFLCLAAFTNEAHISQIPTPMAFQSISSTNSPRDHFPSDFCCVKAHSKIFTISQLSRIPKFKKQTNKQKQTNDVVLGLNIIWFMIFDRKLSFLLITLILERYPIFISQNSLGLLHNSSQCVCDVFFPSTEVFSCYVFNYWQLDSGMHYIILFH